MMRACAMRSAVVGVWSTTKNPWARAWPSTSRRMCSGDCRGTSRKSIDAVASVGIVFDAVAQERSLTRAGQRLGMSQPAVSHALARLRVMLKDELFVRTPEGMLPTARAERMAGPAREALRNLRLTLESAEFDAPRAPLP